MNTLEDLLKHSGWLRGLARSLVADTQTADDLVQDTWVAALRRPSPREIRPWLGRVLRNVARQRYREEGRRVERERAAARHEELPSAQELGARMELQRTMVELVLGLDQPYRSTVVLRYYEGLSAAEIARRKGLPGATVRSHLKRGLDELRRRLDERHEGGREAWSVVLLPWLSMKPETALGTASIVTTLLQGVLTMSTAAKLGIGAAAVTLALLSYELARPDTGAIEPIEVLVGPSDASEPVPEAAPPGPEESASSERTVMANAPAPVSAPLTARDPDGPFIVTAQIVDEHMRPLAQAIVTLATFGVESEPTGSDGQAQLELTLETAGRYRIEVACSGFATRSFGVSLDPEVPAELDPIVLQPAGRITGIVIDHEGVPVAGAEVVITPRRTRLIGIETLRRVGPDRYQGVVELRSEADGRFRADGVAAGEVRVWAGSARKLWAVSELITLTPGAEPVEVRLQLGEPKADEILDGIVLDPDGGPVPDCTVRRNYRSPLGSFTRWATTAANGRFEFLASKNGRTDVRAHAPDGRWSDAILHDATTGSEVVLRFRDTRTVPVLVQDARRSSLANATVQAIAHSERGTLGVGRGIPSDVETGVYELREPAEPFTLNVQALGYEDYESETFAAGELPQPFIVTLVELPGIHGRVFIGERAVSRVRMKLARHLLNTGNSHEVVHHQGFPTELDPYATFDVETDEEGRFMFAPQEPGDYAVRAEFDGYAPGELRLHDYDPATGARDLEIRLGQGGRVRGEVLPPDGVDAGGMKVVASRGDAHLCVQRVGDDGSFLFERLIPGRWNVEVVKEELEDLPTNHSVTQGRRSIPWVCEVFEGTTTRHDLDLLNHEPCIVSGQLMVNGEAAIGWTASLRPHGGDSHRASESPHARLDEDGRFELSVAKPREYALSVECPEGVPQLSLNANLELEPGKVDWALAIETGSAVIDGVPFADSYRDYLFLKWIGPAGASSLHRLEPDANGHCEIECFPVGEIQIRGYYAASNGPILWRVLVSGHVESGQTAHFVIP